MKETRISLLLLLSMSLLLLAFVILFIWGFMYYRKAINAVPPATAVLVQDSPGIADRARDSMQRVFTATINKINATLDSTRTDTDSIQLTMEARLNEFYSLKNEIDRLYDTKLTPAQVAEARRKLSALQLRLEEWRIKYVEVTEENKRLSGLIANLSQDKRSTELSSISRPIPEANRPVTKQVSNLNPASQALAVTDVQLKAIMDNSQQETYQALQTGLLQGSFVIKANGISTFYDEIYVVLQQPDGRVLKQSAWDSGSFETPDGRKLYSYKLKFDYQQGENKRLHFVIEAEQYQKGTYTMQVYHNGLLLARATKSLS